jgi:hypothetical protein
MVEMPRAIKASDVGLKPHFKIRIFFVGGVIHTASWDRPVVNSEREITADWVNDFEYGDEIGFVDWDAVVAISWRWSELCLIPMERFM